MSLMDKDMEPNGALSSGLGDIEGQVPGRNPAPGPCNSMASEDLEMFVLDFEDYGLWEPIKCQPSPMARAAACE